MRLLHGMRSSAQLKRIPSVVLLLLPNGQCHRLLFFFHSLLGLRPSAQRWGEACALIPVRHSLAETVDKAVVAIGIRGHLGRLGLWRSHAADLFDGRGLVLGQSHGPPLRQPVECAALIERDDGVLSCPRQVCRVRRAGRGLVVQHCIGHVHHTGAVGTVEVTRAAQSQRCAHHVHVVDVGRVVIRRRAVAALMHELVHHQHKLREAGRHSQLPRAQCHTRAQDGPQPKVLALLKLGERTLRQTGRHVVHAVTERHGSGLGGRSVRARNLESLVEKRGARAKNTPPCSCAPR